MLAIARGFLLLISIVFTTATVHAESPLPTARVALILPLSGDAASLGMAFRNGFQLGLESLPPEMASRITAVYEDDRLSSATAVSLLAKLLATDSIDVLINLSSGTGKALAPIAEREKLPFLAVASDPEIPQGRSYVVNFWVTPDEEVNALIPALKQRNLKRIALYTTVHEGALAMREAFLRLGKGEIEFVIDDEVMPSDKDFRTQALKVIAKKGGIDAVAPLVFPGQLANFAMQFRRAGVKQQFVGFEFFEDVQEIRLAQGAMDGALFVNASDGDGSFLERYRKRFPGASTYSAGNGYDAAMLIAEALKSGGGREHINTFLHTFRDFSGALGKYSATNDNRFTLPASVKQIRGESFELVR